jgi:protein-histidine N-methyltransferase
MSSRRASFCLTLADYNDCVLKLATIPNIILTRVLGCSDAVTASFGDLEISPAVLQNFEDDLSKHNIHISTISGAWGPKFIDSVKSKALPTSSSLCLDRRPKTLILASETIYSPSTITCFVSTLLGLLAAAEDQGRTARALIAAKKVYFGIGGGVDEFLVILQKNGGQAKMVWELEGEGVDRVILEVTRSTLGWYS